MKERRLFLACAALSAALMMPTTLPAQHRGNYGQGAGRENNHRGSNTSNGQRGDNRDGRRGGENNNRPGGNNVRPGGNNVRPGGNNVRPGGNNMRPGGDNMRPGKRPEQWQHDGRRPNVRPQQPAPRPPRPPQPSHVRPVPPRPGMPHPGFGGRPAGWQWGRPMPVRPVRPPRLYGAQPMISFGLGMTYGMLLDAGLNALVNAGVNVVGAVSDAIYARNVLMAGVTWPFATMYYDGGRLSGARYQYSAGRASLSKFNRAYTQLCSIYGAPESTDFTGASRIATWWGGGNTGYITLSYQPAYDDWGNMQYCTDLVYGIDPDY